MRKLRSIGFTLAFVSVLQACKGDGPTPDVLLVVETAQQQPGRDDLGIIVLIQSLGGKWLEVEVEGGMLEGGKTGGCFLAPQGKPISQSLTTLLVFPTQVEAVLTVRLLPDGPSVNGSGVPPEEAATDAAVTATDAGSGFTVESNQPRSPCGIVSAPLREVTKPISRASAVAPPTAAGGSSGVGGTASTGGVSGASGGSGGEPSGNGGAADSGVEGTGGTAQSGGSGGVPGTAGAATDGGAGSDTGGSATAQSTAGGAS